MHTIWKVSVKLLQNCAAQVRHSQSERACQDLHHPTSLSLTLGCDFERFVVIPARVRMQRWSKCLICSRDKIYHLPQSPIANNHDFEKLIKDLLKETLLALRIWRDSHVYFGQSPRARPSTFPASRPFSRDLKSLPWNPAIVGVWSQKRLPWNDCIGCEDNLKSESKSDNFLPGLICLKWCCIPATCFIISCVH